MNTIQRNKERKEFIFRHAAQIANLIAGDNEDDQMNFVKEVIRKELTYSAKTNHCDIFTTFKRQFMEHFPEFNISSHKNKNMNNEMSKEQRDFAESTNKKNEAPEPSEELATELKSSHAKQDAKGDGRIMPSAQRELTYGEKAVGITFNVGGSLVVNSIKRRCADLINELDFLRHGTNNAEQKRLYSVAITEIQSGQMWGVKAATWQY